MATQLAQGAGALLIPGVCRGRTPGRSTDFFVTSHYQTSTLGTIKRMIFKTCCRTLLIKVKIKRYILLVLIQCECV